MLYNHNHNHSERLFQAERVQLLKSTLIICSKRLDKMRWQNRKTVQRLLERKPSSSSRSSRVPSRDEEDEEDEEEEAEEAGPSGSGNASGGDAGSFRSVFSRDRDGFPFSPQSAITTNESDEEDGDRPPSATCHIINERSMDRFGDPSDEEEDDDS